MVIETTISKLKIFEREVSKNSETDKEKKTPPIALKSRIYEEKRGFIWKFQRQFLRNQWKLIEYFLRARGKNERRFLHIREYHRESFNIYQNLISNDNFKIEIEKEIIVIFKKVTLFYHFLWIIELPSFFHFKRISISIYL